MSVAHAVSLAPMVQGTQRIATQWVSPAHSSLLAQDGALSALAPSLVLDESAPGCASTPIVESIEDEPSEGAPLSRPGEGASEHAASASSETIA
jgi:hypothetical protein